MLFSWKLFIHVWNKSCSKCSKLKLTIFYFDESSKWGSYQSISKPKSRFLRFSRFRKKTKKWNSNLENFEQHFLFHTLYPQMIFIFHLYYIDYTGFSGIHVNAQSNAIISLKPPQKTQIPMFNLFWNLRMHFLGINKNVKRLHDFGSYRTADWSHNIFCSCFYKSVVISKIQS